MKIKIISGQIEPIETELAKVNGRSVQHVFSAAQICELARELERRLTDLGVPAKYRKGATALAVSGSYVANAYKYKREGTWAKLERGAKDWFLVRLEKITLYPQDGGESRLCLTPEQDALAINALRAKFNYSIQ